MKESKHYIGLDDYISNGVVVVYSKKEEKVVWSGSMAQNKQ